MVKKFYFTATVVLAFSVLSFVVAIAQDEAQETKVDKSMCFACHGSFDDIAAATADYVAPSGETITPHRYVPHYENTDIPECVECHVPHPIPPESEDQVVNPGKVDWCYLSCHHMSNFQPCTMCH